MSSSIALDTVFTLRLSDLRAGCKLNGSTMESAGVSKWLELYSDKEGGDDGKTLNGFDPAEFVSAFDRTELNKSYVDVTQPSGEEPAQSYRDGQVAKVQLDTLAGMERDLRMRYRSRVRMLAHGVARAQSHGLAIGPIERGIVNFVKILMDRRT